MPDTFPCHASGVAVLTPCAFTPVEPPALKVFSSWLRVLPTLLSLSSLSQPYSSPLLCALLGNSCPKLPGFFKLKPDFPLKTPLQTTLKQILLIFSRIFEPGYGSLFLFCHSDALSSRTMLPKHGPPAWATFSCSGCYWTFPQMLTTDTFPLHQQPGWLLNLHMWIL